MVDGAAHDNVVAGHGPAANGHRRASRDERQGSPQPVTCARCAATVVAVKFSAAHTSVQWRPDALAACAEFRERAAAGEQSALIDTCLSLRDAIERAVAEGRLAVSPP